MLLKDELAYIPLFATSVVATLILVLLFLIKKKSTARISFVAYLATILIILGTLITGFENLNNNIKSNSSMLFIMSAFLFCAVFVVLPYCIILYTFEPKKIEKLVPPSANKNNVIASTSIQEEQIVNKTELSQVDNKILELGKKFIREASVSFSKENGIGDLLNLINVNIKNEINADGSIILMVDDFEDIIAVKAFDGDFPPPYKLPSDMPHKPVRVATNFKFASFPLRENIFGEIATSGKAELITKPELDDRIYQNGPEEFLECGSYIFSPMKINGTVIGLLALARKRGNTLFTDNDLDLANNLSDFAAATIHSVITLNDTIEHNELLVETKIANQIQDVLHPSKLPVIKDIQIGSIWNPVDGVCGDYYDVIVSRKDRISFIMGDVAGKGINSVIIMSMLRAMLRLVVNTTQSASKILEWVNHGISGENFNTDHFASCALLNYDPTSRKLEISTGGTTPVYYFDSESKEMKKLSVPSEPIGVDKTSTYENIFQEIKNGDIIVTYTDGLVEALNDQGLQYGKEKLLDLITKHSNASSKDIANLVKSDVKKFIGTTELHDDQTLLVIKF